MNPWIKRAKYGRDWVQAKFERLSQYVAWKADVNATDVMRTLVLANEFCTERHPDVSEDFRISYLKEVLWRKYTSEPQKCVLEEKNASDDFYVAYLQWWLWEEYAKEGRIK